MVPTNEERILLISNLKTINNILDSYIKNSEKLKECIINKDWLKINEITLNNNELNIQIENSLKLFSFISTKNFNKNDEEINNLKKEIFTKIKQYKELEKLNLTLLNDLIFVTKKLIENVSIENKTYTKKVKKVNFNVQPLVYNKVI